MNYLINRLNQRSNGYKSGCKEIHVKIPYINLQSDFIKNANLNYIKILEILRNEGYIRAFFIKKNDNINLSSNIIIYLKYDSQGNPARRRIFRVSTPGRKIYLSTKVLWQPLYSTGIFVIATPQGVRTDITARFKNVGGKVLFGMY